MTFFSQLSRFGHFSFACNIPIWYISKRAFSVVEVKLCQENAQLLEKDQ